MILPINIAKTTTNPSKPAFSMMNILLAFGATGLLALIGLIINYYPAGNDLWDNHYLSMAITFSDIKSLYDGFFPIGYSLLLKALVGYHFPVYAAFYVNVILALFLFLTIAWYLSKNNQKLLFPIWLLIFILFPRSFQYLITPGPDIAAAALFTIGIVLQLSRSNSAETGRDSRRDIFLCILSGILMGAAALIRYHAFPASIFFLFTYFVFIKNGRKLTLLSGISVLFTYLPQIVVNVLSGHGPLETYHALNLYNLVHTVNWFHMEKVIPLPSAKSIILGAPLLFLKHYLRWFVALAVFALPPLAYGFFAKKKNKFLGYSQGYCVAGFCGLYAVFFGISASPRAVLFLVPISLLFLVKLLFTLELSKQLKTTVLCVSCVCACMFLYKDTSRVTLCKRNFETYKKIETFLIGQGVKNAQETFTCDYDLYFKTLFPYRPLFNGGWGRIATYKYSEFFPELAVDSIVRFYNDCIKHNVRYIILNGNAPKLADFCDGLYTGSIVDPRFAVAFVIGDKKVFHVVQVQNNEPKKISPL